MPGWRLSSVQSLPWPARQRLAAVCLVEVAAHESREDKRLSLTRRGWKRANRLHTTVTAASRRLADGRDAVILSRDLSDAPAADAPDAAAQK